MDTIYKKNKHKFQNINIDPIKIPDLEVIEMELFKHLSDSKGAIREMCIHILGAGGKRIRPLLVLYCGQIFSGNSPELVNAAVAAELIHMASLVHDDIIDHSNLRRNRPSINRQWGNHYAVLCGDYLFAKAFGILANARQSHSMDMMVNAIQEMCHGEILQAGTLHRKDTTMEMYYERIAKKTAIFLSNCCKSGAGVAGACDEDIHLSGEFGLNLGFAFQIIDDILDFCGKPEIIGKPVGEDLSQGIITLPVILLLQDETYRSWLEDMIDHKKLSTQDIHKAVNVIIQSGALKLAYEIAKKHISIAQDCLVRLPQGKGTRFLYEVSVKLQNTVSL